MINLAELGRVFIVCGKTDMRRGIDSLAYIVKKSIHFIPSPGASFSSAAVARTASRYFIGMARASGCSISALIMGSLPGQTMKTKCESCLMSKSCA